MSYAPPEVTTSARRLPSFAAGGAPRRPISFVTVHYSGDLRHNLDRSACVHDPLNELVVVDNRGNVFFDTLSAAIREGASRARHDLVVFVHEDVLLLDGWQSAFERSLDELERVDPEWGIVGVAGLRQADRSASGHWSDPHGYHDHLGGRPFAEVDCLDEHLLALRRRELETLDEGLPSIHNLGRDLALAVAREGRRTYVVDAPTVHKYADAEGRPIAAPSGSPKIVARSSLTWLAERAVSDDYLAHKWGETPLGGPTAPLGSASPSVLSRPVLLLGRGGGGTRLLGVAAADAGIFVGNEMNGAFDAMELVPAVYKAVLVKHRNGRPWQVKRAVAELRDAAGAMLERGAWPDCWGFKIPESLLILDLLVEAFPEARVAHLVRDPLRTCLRRTHMTARLDNAVGQAALVAAYAHAGRDRALILDDSPALRMAYTTLHQVEGALELEARVGRERWLTLRFEDLLERPRVSVERLSTWLGTRAAAGAGGPCARAQRLEGEADPKRAGSPSVTYTAAEAAEVASVLAPLRGRLGYAV